MRILVADNDPVARHMLQLTLERWGYEVEAVDSGEQAWERLSIPGGPRIAIVEWLMDGLDGAELCRKLRNHADGQFVYVLLCSTRSGGNELVEALGAGADDYMLKPHDAGELKARLRCGLRILNLQNELVMAREALRDQATFDATTGAYNRGAIIDLLEREVSRAQRDCLFLSVVMCDLDHFKEVNDTFGHQVGDQVLIEATARLHKGVRHYDRVGRYGGEEFLLVLPGCSAENAAFLSDRLRQSIAGQAIDTPQGSVSVTCSFGVATYESSPEAAPVDGETLIRVADEALYSAKDNGRNRVFLGTMPGGRRDGANGNDPRA